MNSYLLAIDPSLRSSGVALFCNEVLVATAFFTTPKKLVRYDAMLYQCKKVLEFMSDSCVGYESIHCVVEEQVRRGEDEKMSMDDFIRLASLSYMIIPIYLREYVTLVKPSTWKGSVLKPVMCNRIYENEIKLGSTLSLFEDRQEDILDAIGIGRWYYRE